MRLTDRRSFLAGACASALAQTPPQIIDAHTHFFDPARPQGVPWPAKTEAVLYKQTLPKHFQEATRGLGVRGTVVVEASAWLEDTYCSAFPKLFWIIAYSVGWSTRLTTFNTSSNDWTASAEI